MALLRLVCQSRSIKESEKKKLFTAYILLKIILHYICLIYTDIVEDQTAYQTLYYNADEHIRQELVTVKCKPTVKM